MENPNQLKENPDKPQRKTYIKPQIEIVQLLPKQTVLGTACFSTSLNTGSLNLGCYGYSGGCVDL